ncbi:MAG: sensor histidine kinase [Lachnospiraceae bacterium]|nr:sensor histidine kinase [Lachnospiraceae bacterium]
MKKRGNGTILREVLRKNILAIGIFFVITLTNVSVFALYDILTEPLVYATVLAAVLLAVALLLSFLREKRESAEREHALASILTDWRSLPEGGTPAEADYREMILRLGAELERITAEADAERQDMLDYYTAWVHQIKTPIAVMRLKLADDTPEHHALNVELSRIESYAEMALQYIRIDSDSNDLLIREYDLDEILRESVRKLAPQFVEKRIALNYAGTDVKVVTDRKWLSCILEQLLSNAVKYTPAGAVTIEVREGAVLISDTGIGIASEDLPRIFEKGYTGINGRLDKKSSGLGLYLAKKAADLMALKLTAESKVGEGTCFTVAWPELMNR